MICQWEKANEAEKRKRKKAQKEVDWLKYFNHIKGVCPWSLRAYMQDKILVWTDAERRYKTLSKLFTSTNHEAFVYTFPGKSADWLESQCELLNKTQTECEWLWSHPDADSGEGNSTPVPVLIQQDREMLNTLREKIGYIDE